jgi:alkane 1-monooxygenase
MTEADMLTKDSAVADSNGKKIMAKISRYKQRYIEKSYYPWFLHFVSLCLLPLMHYISWKICESFHYAQWTFIAFFIYPIWIFIMIPLLDYLLNKYHVYSEQIDTSVTTNNKPSATYKKLSKEEMREIDRKYTWVLRCYVFIHLSMWIYSFYKLKELKEKSPVQWYKSSVFWMQLIVLGMIQTAPGIPVSHELFHRLNNMDRFLGNLLLTTMLYTHFSIEHVYGHHKNVATIFDPATARFNQTVYSFWFQSVLGGYLHAWKIEWDLLRHKLNTSPWYVLFIQNRILHYSILCYLVLPMCMYLWRGTLGLLALFIQAIVAIWFIESINYVEHYGLERKQIGTKSMSPSSTEPVPVYEPVTNKHSWDQPHGHLMKLFFCNLILHSDHHYHPLKRYEWLEPSKDEETPTLPFSYPIMTLLVLVPQLFFKIMHQNPVFAHKVSNTNGSMKGFVSAA